MLYLVISDFPRGFELCSFHFLQLKSLCFSFISAKAMHVYKILFDFDRSNGSYCLVLQMKWPTAPAGF